MLITLGLFVCFQNPHALYNSLKQTVINADVHPETFAMMVNIDFPETLLIEANKIIFFSTLYVLYELGRILSSSFDYHMYSNTRSIAFIPYKYTFLFSQKIYKNIIQCFLSSNKDVGMPVEVKQQYFSRGFTSLIFIFDLSLVLGDTIAFQSISKIIEKHGIFSHCVRIIILILKHFVVDKKNFYNSLDQIR